MALAPKTVKQTAPQDWKNSLDPVEREAEIVSALVRQLGIEFRRGISEKSLRHALRFVEAFHDFEIVSVLRECFHLPESKSAIVSQIIAASIEAGLIKLDEKVGASKKFARYLPFWA